MTITTLALHVRALAFSREAKMLSPFAQLVVDEAGGMQRGPSGLYQMRDAGERLLRLHGAVAPDELLLWGDAGQAREKFAASRMLTSVPRTSVHGAVFLHDNDGEGLANGLHFAMQQSGRVPERLIVIMNEGAEFEEQFIDRARWLLDVPEIVTRCVDVEVGMLERDVLAVAPHADDPSTLLSILEARDADGAL